jgi:hypothetical protein
MRRLLMAQKRNAKKAIREVVEATTEAFSSRN